MRPSKVLVVDDSKLMHRMFEVMLRNHTLVHAFDGRQALDEMRRHGDVELVLLDINMPNMNGLEFLAQQSADSKLNGVPVIVISTEGKEEDAQRGLEAGAAAYIKKPFQSEELLRVIGEVEPA